MGKEALINFLKTGEAKREKKAYTFRTDKEIFDRIEAISEESGIKNLNTVINALIEIGLAEYNKA